MRCLVVRKHLLALGDYVGLGALLLSTLLMIFRKGGQLLLGDTCTANARASKYTSQKPEDRIHQVGQAT